MGWRFEFSELPLQFTASQLKQSCLIPVRKNQLGLVGSSGKTQGRNHYLMPWQRRLGLWISTCSAQPTTRPIQISPSPTPTHTPPLTLASAACWRYQTFLSHLPHLPHTSHSSLAYAYRVEATRPLPHSDPTHETTYLTVFCRSTPSLAPTVEVIDLLCFLHSYAVAAHMQSSFPNRDCHRVISFSLSG